MSNFYTKHYNYSVNIEALMAKRSDDLSQDNNRKLKAAPVFTQSN